MSSIAGHHDLHAQTMLFEQVATLEAMKYIDKAFGRLVERIKPLAG